MTQRDKSNMAASLRELFPPVQSTRFEFRTVDNDDHAHEFGEWLDDPAGAVRVCACGAIDWRPEG